MMRLQAAGVPAGVCQNAEDRCDHDPQLRQLKWLTEVTGTKIGTWPVDEVPMKMSRDAGLYRRPDQPRRAVLRRGQRRVLTELLGMSEDEMAELTEQGVL